MPHLKRLEINNFKSWEKAEIDFAPVTAFFGPNSSGKTSLIQFLLMLKQTKEATDRNLVLNFGGEGSLANLGSFQETVFNHELKRKITWKLDWERDKDLEIANPETKSSILFKGKNISVSSDISFKKSPTCTLLEYIFAGQRFQITSTGQDGKFSLSPGTGDTNAKYKFVRTQGRAWPLPGPVKSYLFPDQAKTYFQNSGFLGYFEEEFETLMDKIFYLGPLREYPHREYRWAGISPTDVGRRGEAFVAAILAARERKDKIKISGRRSKILFEEGIAYWLKELGLIHEFKVISIGDEQSQLYSIPVRKNVDSTEVLITDVGFGVSQILPAIVLLHYVPEGSVVILEQPEIHLHPAVQSDLADVIIHAARQRNIQVIVESHSEHLLRRLQRRMAEGKSIHGQSIDREDFKLYFCEMKNGASHLEYLRLNTFGEIENWPEDFFGDEFGEVVATRKAGLKRKIATREAAE